MPLLDIQTQQSPSRHEHTAIVVGGYSPQCRWYSEDAATLAENMRVGCICDGKRQQQGY